MIRFRRVLAVLTVIVLTGSGMTGCALGGNESPSQSEETSPGYDATALPPSFSSKDIQQHKNLNDEHSLSWYRYDIVSDRLVRVHFTMGNPECYGVRAVVNEETNTVRIALHEGTLPGSPAHCSLFAAMASLLLTTQNPIGTRSIVPGD
ncbi:hypothetical protein [Bifidobacterium aquikefiricola]|uniref:Lipoprotein n=1 Tax=Bifidobacterium aquikefiricola TaxID=3059038 RepID=A0AB39U512_9BIFI